MKVFNRRAKRDYQLLDKVETGIVLTGAEVKSVGMGRIRLDEAYVRIIKGEVYLVNAFIHPYRFADTAKIDPKRSRKLLLHRREILALEQKMKQKNLTIVPVLCYSKGRQIKLEIALAKGKREYEKREAIKRRDLDRETEREVASKTRG